MGWNAAASLLLALITGPGCSWCGLRVGVELGVEKVRVFAGLGSAERVEEFFATDDPPAKVSHG